MSRTSSSSQQRSLTQTEELEKLEQSITLTLQEIDHNFSKAHRIVTSSILPIVAQYAEHSRDVWEGSKFWKQFFESSANVSLSGYEEQPSMHDTVEETVTDDSDATTHTTLETSKSYETPSSQHYTSQTAEDQLDLSSLTISPTHSTPRPNARGPKLQDPPMASFGAYPSPYEILRQEVSHAATETDFTSTPASRVAAHSPVAATQGKDIAMTPDASPFLPRMATARPSTARKKTDPLLHHILDKNYRVQATPLANGRRTQQQQPAGARHTNPILTPATAARTKLVDLDLSSSPAMPEPPTLHPEIFSSPVRTKDRTPGISVLTPAKSGGGILGARTGIWDDDDDFDDDGDAEFGSPPKTVQFHIPQSRLLKTPAKEASKRIVDDILMTAGIADVDGDYTDDIDDHFMDPTSPSVVRKAEGFEEDTF